MKNKKKDSAKTKSEKRQSGKAKGCQDFSCIIAKFLGEAWLVGGALRDALLGKKSGDLDIVLSPCTDFKKKVIKLASALKSSAFEMDAENSVWRITGPKTAPFQLDIMPFQGKSLEDDILRRDFTVNALAIKLSEKCKILYSSDDNLFEIKFSREDIVDLCGGIRDIEGRKIKIVSDKAFQEDPLRMLRAYRIAAQHDMRICTHTVSIIKRDSKKISQSAGERICEELMLCRDDSCKWIKKIHEAGLLFEILPELKPQPLCAQEYYGKGGVLRHTFNVLDRTDVFFARMSDFCPHHEDIKKHLSAYQPGLYKFAALMHDIAKPAKAAFINGRLRFFGHEECGAIMSAQIMERLHFSKDEIRLVSAVIGSHLRPGSLAVNETISQKAMFRLFRAMGNAVLPLLVLCWADYASYITPARLEKFRPELSKLPQTEDISKLPYNSPKKTLRFMQAIYYIAGTYIKKAAELHGKSFADGHDVIDILKIQPGPQVGQVLEQMRMMQFEGKINSREEAILWLKTIAKEKNI